LIFEEAQINVIDFGKIADILLTVLKYFVLLLYSNEFGSEQLIIFLKNVDGFVN
jgi:hypothetical protein